MTERDWAQFEKNLCALRKRLKNRANKLTFGNSALAEDMTQEAMLKAWSYRESYDPNQELYAWVVFIMRNCYYSYLRSIEYKQHVKNGTEFNQVDLILAPEDQHTRLEAIDALNLINRLPPLQREAMLLLAQEYESIEIAELVGITAGGMRKRIFLARDALKAMGA